MYTVSNMSLMMSSFLIRNTINRASNQQGGCGWGDSNGCAVRVWCSQCSLHLHVLLYEVKTHMYACLYISARNKDQKLVGHYLKMRRQVRLSITNIPLKILSKFGWLSVKIVWKMTNSQLLFLALTNAFAIIRGFI